ncbi:3-oxoacyl-ACP synthase III family protein [Anaerocolumna aminovalerica]|uniref:3-oxoacyl-[acyl-carrier-protein] synthase-3 n=1 Tax=Anaerocolumna aminovalerica TaxID=1527 RepID=A0A1I5J2S8_9FIRM|nr:3-oxoacyl-[acyl-carrier-protein] synthase III C-terminal domain-containing protein [Anaerocolumna aminovalerica]SFO66930.1 3-oxoacyl-[acyl-carrier-protein] synthase-3 [Anaerocolumna aminovalerica]
MNKGIVMKSVGIYHPEKKIGNESFINHFKNMDETLGERVSHLLTHLGRQERYIADFPNENVITMAINASKSAIEKAGIDPLELDGIIFSTDTPEYTSPSNAILLRDALEASNAHTVYDLNANCVGMVVAVDQAQALMKCNKRLKKILVVGSTMIHHFGLETDPITYGALGDAAAAVILETVETDKQIGFIDSVYATRTDLRDYILMPECGMSNIYDSSIPEEKKRWKWQPFDTEEPESRCGEIIKQVLNENGFAVCQANMIFMTQFSEDAIKNVSNALDYPLEQFKYVGNQYGYTGTSSPFMAYYHAITQEQIKENDVVVFCSVGSGLTAASLLYIAG